MTRHIRTSEELEQLAREMKAKARLRAQQEDNALRRSLGNRSHDWIISNSDGAKKFLTWLDTTVTDGAERRALRPILELLQNTSGIKLETGTHQQKKSNGSHLNAEPTQSLEQHDLNFEREAPPARS